MSGITLNKFFDVGCQIEAEDTISSCSIDTPSKISNTPIPEKEISGISELDKFIYSCNIDLHCNLDVLLPIIAKLIEIDEKTNHISIQRIYLCESTDTWRCVWLDRGISKCGEFSGSVPESIKNIPDIIDKTLHSIRDIAHPRDGIYLFWGWATSSSQQTSLWHNRVDLDHVD